MARETRVHSQVESHQKLFKMVLDASLLNTQHYKVRIKGKVEQSRDRSNALPYLGVVAFEKGAFGSPSTTVANFTFTIIGQTKTKNLNYSVWNNILDNVIVRVEQRFKTMGELGFVELLHQKIFHASEKKFQWKVFQL